MYWTDVEQQLPKEGQHVQAKFLYYYKYADREAEARVDTDNFTYKNGMWITDEGESFLGKRVTKQDIKILEWRKLN